MNGITFVYPGSFCPPTYGHWSIVKQAAYLCDELLVLCSENPDKAATRLFTPQECVALWKTYPLPDNVRVEYYGQRLYDPAQVVMIRGLRNTDDIAHEFNTLIANYTKLHVSKSLYIVSDLEHKDISSSDCLSKVRDFSFVMGSLTNKVSPQVLTAMVERNFGLRSFSILAGPPAGGKSTVGIELSKLGTHNLVIDTDELSAELKPMLLNAFPGESLLQLALTDEERLLAVIREPWLEKIKVTLQVAMTMHGIENIFLEIPYALQDNKQLYHNFGGRVFYIYADPETLISRLQKSGKPHLMPFLAKVPLIGEASRIAYREQLYFTAFDSTNATGAALADNIMKRVWYDKLYSM